VDSGFQVLSIESKCLAGMTKENLNHAQGRLADKGGVSGDTLFQGIRAHF
jgi:hypothetical protein